MSAKTIVFASMAAVALAASPVPVNVEADGSEISDVHARGAGWGGCPVTECRINTSGTYWNVAYVRPNASNNQAPLKTLRNGARVYNLNASPKWSNLYQYQQVIVPSGNKNTVGWVASFFLDCDDWAYPPAPAPANAGQAGKSA